MQKPRNPRLRCGGTARQRLSCGVFGGIDGQSVIDLLTAMFAGDGTPVLAFQRVAGNAHELDALHAELRRIQARLSATEDDDELDALVAERKAVKARIEAFAVVPDRFDYAPTGRTAAWMWNEGDDAVKRGMVRAVWQAWGLALVRQGGQWGLAVGTAGPLGTRAVLPSRGGTVTSGLRGRCDSHPEFVSASRAPAREAARVGHVLAAEIRQ